MRNRVTYETDDEAFPAEAYSVKGYRGIAFRVYGWETEPEISLLANDDGEEWEEYWDGESMKRTGRVVVVMVGDDYRHVVDLEDCTPLDDLDYCATCGQVGCTHDGRDREEV